MKLKQQLKTPTNSQLNSHSNLVIILPKGQTKAKWPVFPHSKTIKERMSRAGKQCGTTAFSTDLPNKTGTHTVIACIKKDISSFELLSLCRKLAEEQLKLNPKEIALYMPNMEGDLATRTAEAMIATLLAARYHMPSYKSKKDKPLKLNSLQIYNLPEEQDFEQTFAEAEGNNLARYLTALPPNELTPGLYRKRITTLAKEYGWKMDFLDMKTLRRKKAGAFVAVAQGSPTEDAGIVHLQYKPRSKSKLKKLALVGKGICFDTGGMNLKPAQYMHGMHEDMEGSAVALGTLIALTILDVNFEIDCWLALAQNHIGPKAYKQNDVVTAYNGTSIEIIHTDAEGRMVLADTLAIATKDKPDLLMDYATLTGSCVAALGTVYSGAFTNKPEYINDIIDAGRDSGERTWPFPLDEDYDKDLESTIADIKQCTLTSGPDHIHAARFLQRFINKTPWIHVDLSAGNNKGGLAHIATDTTAFGVRFTLDFILNKKQWG